MRILEPHQRSTVQKKRPMKWTIMILSIMFVIIIVLIGLYLKFVRSSSVIPAFPTDNLPVKSSQVNDTQQVNDSVNDSLRLFSDNEFRLLYDNVRQSGLEPVENTPVITGNDITDMRIRKIAEERGYRLRHSANVVLVPIDGQKLQTAAATAWEKLKQAALTAGYDISLVSGFRSVDDQRELFLQRLYATGATVKSIETGDADNLVDSVLQTTSIPGYSKHHTGYTLDLYCAGFAFEKFKDSTCHTWLSAENYKKAKEYGFIPSYPSEAAGQGPDPEAWEYVYVGTELLYE